MMSFSPTILTIVILILLIEGFFSGSELALLSADRILLKKKSKQGDFGSQLALRLLKTPDRILSTTLLMTSTCVMTISVLLTLEFRRLVGEHAELYAVVAGSLLVIVFGELIPKLLYRKFSSRVASRISIPIFYTQKFLSPFIYLTTLYTSKITKVITPIGRRSTTRSRSSWGIVIGCHLLRGHGQAKGVSAGG